MSTELTRDEAIAFITKLPFLVATSNYKLLESQMDRSRDLRKVRKRLRERVDPIIRVAFVVTVGRRSYTFAEQPFRVVREISKADYRRILPGGVAGLYCYEIHTD